MAVLLAGTSHAVVINTPIPMAPPAFPSCEQFYLASPDVSCWDAAASHSISVEHFVALNPGILSDLF
jgi:hypothetical protein